MILKLTTQITNSTVKIVNLPEIDSKHMYLISEAIELAQKYKMDLCEVAIVENISICKILNLESYLYQQKKKQKLIKSNRAKMVKLNSCIDDRDLSRYIDQIKKFVNEKRDVSILVITRRRRASVKQNLHKANIIDRIQNHGILLTATKTNNKYKVSSICNN